MSINTHSLPSNQSEWTSELVTSYLLSPTYTNQKVIRAAWDWNNAQFKQAVLYAIEAFRANGIDPSVDMSRLKGFCRERVAIEKWMVENHADFFLPDRITDITKRPHWLSNSMINSGRASYTTIPNKVASIFQALIAISWSKARRKSRAPAQRSFAPQHVNQSRSPLAYLMPDLQPDADAAAGHVIVSDSEDLNTQSENNAIISEPATDHVSITDSADSNIQPETDAVDSDPAVSIEPSEHSLHASDDRHGSHSNEPTTNTIRTNANISIETCMIKVGHVKREDEKLIINISYASVSDVMIGTKVDWTLFKSELDIEGEEQVYFITSESEVWLVSKATHVLAVMQQQHAASIVDSDDRHPSTLVFFAAREPSDIERIPEQYRRIENQLSQTLTLASSGYHAV